MAASRRRTELEKFVVELLERFERSMLDISTPVIRRWGTMVGNLEIAGRRLPILDSLMAATALEHDMTIVTRNESDLKPTGVRVLNIWSK